MPDRIQETVWNWRAAPVAEVRPSPGMVIFRTMWVLVVAVILLVLGHRWPAFIIGGIGLATMLLGFAAPGAWLKLGALGDRFGAWVGRILGWILLTPVFYLLIVPGALFLRAVGRDPLHRHYRSPGLTYWIRRRGQAAPGQYERQFLVEDPQARSEHRPIDPEATP